MSLPMLLIMLFNFAVGFTDVYVAGRIGPKIQAAVGFIDQLYFLFIIFANAISIGSVALVARASGAGHGAEVQAGSRNSLGFGVIVAFTLSVTGVLGTRQVVSAVGVPPELIPIAVTFVRIYAVCLGFNYLLIISSAVLRALGTPEKAAVSMGVFAALNVVLDFALVFGWFPFPALGYPGIPIATGISVISATAINMVFLARLKWPGFFRNLFRLSGSYIKRIIAISWPMALVMFAWNAGTVVVYNIIAHLPEHHIQIMAAYASGSRIESITFLPAFALNNAAAVLVGQNLGAGRSDRAVKVGWEIAVTAALFLGLVAAVIWLNVGRAAAILAKDEEVLRQTIIYLRYNLFLAPVIAVSLSLGGGLQGAGDTRGVLGIIVIAMWIIRLPLAYVMGVTLGWGARGVWTAMIVSMTVQGSLMALRFHLGKWKNVRV